MSWNKRVFLTFICLASFDTVLRKELWIALWNSVASEAIIMKIHPYLMNFALIFPEGFSSFYSFNCLHNIFQKDSFFSLFPFAVGHGWAVLVFHSQTNSHKVPPRHCNSLNLVLNLLFSVLYICDPFFQVSL